MLMDQRDQGAERHGAEAGDHADHEREKRKSEKSDARCS